ncbi:tryptophan synthase beta chain [Candidatus Kryptobacter tengchongensis]|uniref:TrpB-like pyridoxal phosphate-dependent enzyme n=1 Tax=Kryptobacter tengchongensis TaxID=1643429 RepID=UPI000707F99D|nr:TrpB-like pyridoxal phosphate-dependent enzyme [Candidatus Kryptobacter tengchongensis]CUS89196.1 tryptophan synthase beta chain [Candidatus Kryptobacter tengchongensis]CUU01590.1 tryptophan synthase beta chain [Candidatus Kryptobacter tengchongensis]CUU02181.1 tryptophan synthase beta chain [Candidatus Kryptobacter tengchongensis]
MRKKRVGLQSNRIYLSERDIPKRWYNILHDMPEKPKPPLNPKTAEPISIDELAVIFAKGLIEQELSEKQWIDIPEEVLKVYLLWRPTPVVRARFLEEALETPARIYYKYEGVSPSGSHKPNTAVAQAYYNKIEGVEQLTTETGAGQWGSALAFACSYFGLKCKVFMVRASYEQKPYRKVLMQMWGADVVPSPSKETQVGRKILESTPDSPGSLGIAISEAIEVAISDDKTKYSLGSVLNHVLLHQTIIGLEAKKQLDKVEEYPTIVIGCVGGGSNFAGLAFPFLLDKFYEKRKSLRLIAVEPAACPTLTKGIYSYDYGDTSKLTPLLPMYTLGHDFIPPRIHAGGLRYHGMSPIISKLYADGFVEARAYTQNEIFDAAMKFFQTEGIVPAPESAHAIRAVIDEAIRARKEKKEEVILFNLSGHGFFDMSAYNDYILGVLEDVVLTDEDVNELTRKLSSYPKP